MNLEQMDYELLVASNEKRLAASIMFNQSLIDELEKKGIKHSVDEMLFITKDATGQTIWLEKGSSDAGLEHILRGNGRSPGHAKDFERAFGVAETDVASYLFRVVSQGKVVSNELRLVGGRTGFERVYYYSGRYHVVVGVGTNGFIVSAYPKRMG